jgi:hypothetical protein
MIFPFSIKCTRKFKDKISLGETVVVMTYIQDFMARKTCKTITINGHLLTYKPGSFRNKWNTDILATVEKGKFEFVNTGTESILTYEFFMYHLFLWTSLMSILIGVISADIWIGVFCFAWLGVLNWIIAIFRHRLMLKDIVLGIETLINEKKGSL